MSDEGRADLEIEYTSMREYRERLDHTRMKMAEFLVGCAQVVVNNEKCVIFSLTVGRGKIKLSKT
jgi:hypothetical protein